MAVNLTREMLTDELILKPRFAATPLSKSPSSYPNLMMQLVSVSWVRATNNYHDD